MLESPILDKEKPLEQRSYVGNDKTALETSVKAFVKRSSVVESSINASKDNMVAKKECANSIKTEY